MELALGTLFTGLAVGLLIAPVAARALTSFLYGVSPLDGIALAAAPVLILAVSLIASSVPAWTAARSGPLAALRES